MIRIRKVPEKFCFNCGPRWSAVVHYHGIGIGIRDEYDRYRIMLVFWHVMIWR